ncbi:hypothetical protein AB0P17_28050, partial [Streptomyces sp. NPDC088124]|uniref:hypothetical protein n=1 Tax=Streptomyces sp. NPDC088124 TaxID=3154654 RepID=UPI003418D590
AARHRAPVTYLLLDNGGYGAVRALGHRIGVAPGPRRSGRRASPHVAPRPRVPARRRGWICQGATVVEHGSEHRNDEGSASSRYTRDMREARRSGREALRSDLSSGHLGLGATVIVLAVIAGSSGLRWTLIVGGGVTTWFVLALAVIHYRGGRGRDAFRRAYMATFGWGQWL